MSAPKVAFVNLGCRVNRDELDDIADTLLALGCELSPSAEADAVVVNSCAVTAEAEAKTRKLLRRMAALPQAPEVVATGCAVNLFADELRGLAPNISVVRDKSQVATRVLGLVGAPIGGIDDAGLLRGTPTGRTRLGIKIQDGCDRRCSYCIVWKARGRARSIGAGEVVRRVRRASGRGCAEVVLSGINIGSYEAGGLRLSGLLSLLMRETDVRRVRIGSIEPPDVGVELLEVMAANPERIAPFLHICLQSGSDATLSRMGRAYGSAAFARAVKTARRMLPGVALGTDVIVGFPGETKGEFEQSLAFCQEMGFSRMHVFRYSKRPGTPAASAPDQVDPRLAAKRGARMRDLARSMRLEAASMLLGTEQLVVVERRGRGVTGGLFDVRLDPAVAAGTLVRATPHSLLHDGSLLATVA